jgi:hypothetical protein
LVLEKARGVVHVRAILLNQFAQHLELVIYYQVDVRLPVDVNACAVPFVHGELQNPDPQNEKAILLNQFAQEHLEPEIARGVHVRVNELNRLAQEHLVLAISLFRGEHNRLVLLPVGHPFVL